MYGYFLRVNAKVLVAVRAHFPMYSEMVLKSTFARRSTVSPAAYTRGLTLPISGKNGFAHNGPHSVEREIRTIAGPS